MLNKAYDLVNVLSLADYYQYDYSNFTVIYLNRGSWAVAPETVRRTLLSSWWDKTID